MANLLTKELREALMENGRRQARGQKTNPGTMVKLFTQLGGMIWLLTELDPENEDIAFGLADLGFGSPELGSFSLSEIEETTAPGFWAERDLHFRPTKSLEAYADEARAHQRIVA